MLVPRIPPSPIPCVLLGGLNVTRALGLAGIPVWVVSTEAADLAFLSRYAIGHTVLPPLAVAGRAIDALRRLGRGLAHRFGTALPLAFANDEYLRFVYDHRDAIEREFRVLLNTPQLAEALFDKEGFAGLAADLSLPVPASHAFAELAAVRHPVIAKPRSKLGWEASPLRQAAFDGAAKGAIFACGREALAQAWVHRHRDALAFQEYVAGGEEDLWCYDGVADCEGTIVAGYGGHKVRTYPPGAGESSFVVLARNAELEAVARDIARRVALRGMFDMDFKRSRSSGRYYLLEINARYNQWLYPAARAGMPLCRVLHEKLLDGRSDRWQDALPRRYHWLAFDLDRRAWRALAARGELSFARWAWSLATRRKVYNLFSWSDPRPYTHFVVRLFRRLAARGARKWRAAKAE
ncbi:MAG TPA: hypothetical protein VN782_17330 [Usitatibacter sp.]|nr:hypothetical protein [Usitatibacter sp.]